MVRHRSPFVWFAVALACGLGWFPNAFAAIEVAEQLLVDLDARDETAGDDVWVNKATMPGVDDDDFTRLGAPVLEDLNGVSAVTFAVSGVDAYKCNALAPAGIVGLDPTRSIEVWVYNREIAGEETLLAWGRRGGPCGTNMSFNYGTDIYFGAVGHWCHLPGPDIGWGVVPAARKWHHLAYTYDGTTTRVYADGNLSNSEELGAGAINTYADTPILIGDQWDDAGVTMNAALGGTLSLARVRVHDGVLTPEQIRSNYNEERLYFGITDEPPAFVDAPTADEYVPGEAAYTRRVRVSGVPVPTVTIVAPATGGTITASGAGTWEFIYTLPDPAPASFTVTLRASSGTGTATATWNVTKKNLIPGQIVTAGELFVHLDARDETAGDDEWINRGTWGNFRRNGAPVAEQVDGVQAVTLNGNGAQGVDAYVGVNPAPDGIVGVDPTRSIEVWAYNPLVADEETMVAWGHRGGGDGTNMSFNYGTNFMWGAVGHWGGAGPDLGWVNEGGCPEPATWHHLVYTYDGTTTRVYADGEFWNSENLGPGTINTYGNTPIVIGDQWEPDGVTLNPALGGTLSIARVRVHDGVLRQAEIAHNFATERGDFGRIDEAPSFAYAPAEDYYYETDITYTTVVRVSGLPRPTLEMVEPAGATIAADGTITYALPSPVPDSFVVTARATNSAGSKTATWTARRTQPANLTQGPLHRYSFTADATDSVGDADGTPYGNVTFADGQAALANTGAEFSNAADPFPDPALPDKLPPGAYIDLPNGIISVLAPQATFEAWCTWIGPIGNVWQRIFDFGTSAAGEDYSNGANNNFYIFLTPQSGGDTLRFGYRNGAPAIERWIETGRLPEAAEHHVAVTWNDDAHIAALYLDGIRVAVDTQVHITLAEIPDVNNWLGRSQWVDPMFNGSYNEFRIYNYALTPPEVLGNFQAGADTVNTGGVQKVGVFMGNANGDATVNIADAVTILGYLFGKPPKPVIPCFKAADTNDDNTLNVADAVDVLTFLFGAQTNPSKPMTGPDGSAINAAACRGYDPSTIPATIIGQPGCATPCAAP